jgi:hypothetical protein
MQRRDALRYFAATVALPVLQGLTPAKFAAFGHELQNLPGRPDPDGTLMLFDAHQNRTVLAAVERIIPETGTPGAQAVGINRFIDAMLAGWYPPDTRDRVLTGLAELDARARMTEEKPFIECTAAEQSALLMTLDDEAIAVRHATAPSMPPNVPWEPAPNDLWFAIFKFLTLWGYYTSEEGQTKELELYPLPGHYDGCAPPPLPDFQK